MRLFDNILGKRPKPESHAQMLKRMKKQGLRFAPKNQTGIKRWYMLGTLDTIVKTPYGAKELRRRRALGKVAKQARKVNRGLRPTGGRRG
jgi:hypothetical protein